MYETIFVARQPIFTHDMRIWGYELLFRDGKDMRAAVILDGDQATTRVIADGFTLASQGMREGARALINFPRNVLVGSAPYVLPPDRCVVEILETVEPDGDVLEACRHLKDAGYLLALDDFVGQPGVEPLCALADIIKVDILRKTPAEVRAIVQGLAPYKAALLAEKVENQEMFAVCGKLGFTFFQGYFFSKPEVIPGRKFSAGELAKIKLLKELSEPDTDIDRLVEVIQTDLSISYRLFQYINSARFGLRGKIESVHRAATMLGRRNLRLWLQVIILSDMSTSDKAQELVRISVQRGRFLQLLAEEGYTPLEPDSMFLLGFFSMLDAILNQRMEQILEDIPLDIRIKSALIDRSGVHAAWLSVLRDLDSWDWPAVADKAPKLGVPLDLVGMLNLEAWTWMIEVMQGT